MPRFLLVLSTIVMLLGRFRGVGMAAEQGNLEGRPLRVVVTSATGAKLMATEEAVKMAYPGRRLDIRSLPTSSGIAAQPLGESVALRGARQRLSGVPVDIAARADFIVAIENYVARNEQGWYDQAVVIVQSPQDGREHRASSAAVAIAPAAWEQFIERAGLPRDGEGWDITFGQTLVDALPADQALGLSAADWHKLATGGAMGRGELLRDGIFRALYDTRIAALAGKLRMIADFPKVGVLFKDHSPLFADGKALGEVIDILAERCAGLQADSIVGLDARGFIVGAALAQRLGIGFVTVRKQGKLPPPTITAAYEKEYGKDVFAMAADALPSGARVIVVDDLIATGGSALAAISLVKQLGAEPLLFLALSHVPGLSGRDLLGVPSFVLFDS